MPRWQRLSQPPAFVLLFIAGGTALSIVLCDDPHHDPRVAHTDHKRAGQEPGSIDAIPGT
jgi:hypothetical protein